MNQQTAIDLRSEAEAIYKLGDYSLEQAIKALNLIYEASAIERALGLPPQTKRVESYYVPPIKDKESQITPEQREQCEQIARQWHAREEQKRENRKQAAANRKEPETARPGYKELPAQLTFL